MWIEYAVMNYSGFDWFIKFSIVRDTHKISPIAILCSQNFFFIDHFFHVVFEGLPIDFRRKIYEIFGLTARTVVLLFRSFEVPWYQTFALNIFFGERKNFTAIVLLSKVSNV
jgi:hypothetical protein